MGRSGIRCVQVWAPKEICGAADAVGSIVDSFADVLDLAFDVPIVENEIAEEDFS